MATIGHTARRIGPHTRFTRYRGDGWQIYLDDPGLGLWAKLLIAAELRAARGLESRIALGLGSAYGGSNDSLTSAGGSAFVASGRALDALQAPQRLTIGVDSDHIDVLHARLVALIDERVADWSSEQAEAMAYDLAPEQHLVQTEIAARLGVSRQAVAARLKAAGRAQLTGAHEDFFKLFHRDGARDG